MRAIRFTSLLICLAALLVGTSGSGRALGPDFVTLNVSNPTCTQTAASSACMINFRYIYATSSDTNFRGVQIVVNGKTRAYFSNFFESSMYMNDRMIGNGLQVSCGLPNASGLPGYGLQYSVQISALITGGSPVTNVANVICPAYVSKMYTPILRK